MNKNIKTILMAAALPLAMMAAPVYADFIIDDFGPLAPGGGGGTAYSVADNTADSTPNPVSPLAAPALGANTIMNGLADWTRSIQADLISGDLVETEICNNCQAAHLVSNSGSTGNGSFIYEASMGGSVDFSMYSMISFDYAADLAGAVVQFTFAGSTTDIITSGVLASTGTSAPSNLTGASATFGPGNYSAITRIQMDILGVSDLDFTIDNVTAVPEPGTMALLGLGLIGFAFRSRKTVTSVAA
ncbi:MAG: PEP-CTERM sorting domain-containing protein [Methyloprofundus sp.]|nr:PEP-CTERM sorting domain-containing protein [Methyloprofundus sp.]